LYFVFFSYSLAIWHHHFIGFYASFFIEQEGLPPTGDLLKHKRIHPKPVQETKKATKEINKIAHMLLAID